MENSNDAIYDKAFEIYDSFVRISPLYIENKRHESAKKQAINCVDNIINAIKKINAMSLEDLVYMETEFNSISSRQHYTEVYEKVKTALEKF